MEETANTPATKFLGRQTSEPTDALDLVPWEGERTAVVLNAHEFTSHCPVTGQPDFAELKIGYIPDKSLIETKSFKLFLWSYRDKKAFNEKIVNELAQRIFEQAQPKVVIVWGKFAVRGGVHVEAMAVRNNSQDGTAFDADTLMRMMKI